MTAEQIRGLFQAFYQGDASTTRKYGGTGLGLHISKRYATSMGGDIVVQSTHGKGSHFTFVLPISDLAAANLVDAHTVVPERIRADMVPSADPASRHVGRVLIAEDSRDTQRILAFMLARAGLQFEIVDTGQRAVDRALAGHFDVVLMDMQMPEMDGYAAVRCLREQGYSQPIIALTAHAMRADEEKCLAAGCTDYLTKPIDPETLVERVTGHLFAAPATAPEPLHGGRTDRATP
jgi:CheY-like chemotaxis protein